MKKNVFLPLNLGYFICEQHTDYLENSVIIEVKVKYIVKYNKKSVNLCCKGSEGLHGLQKACF